MGLNSIFKLELRDITSVVSKKGVASDGGEKTKRYRMSRLTGGCGSLLGLRRTFYSDKARMLVDDQQGERVIPICQGDIPRCQQN